MMRGFLIAVSLIAVSSAAASARMQVLHATLAGPANERKFVADTVIWDCDGASCVTVSEPSGGSKSICRALAKKVGPVATFEGLDAAQLEKCNGTK